MNPTKRKSWRLASDAVLRNFNELAMQAILAGNPLEVQIMTPRKTASQNAMNFALFSQVALQLEDMSVMDVRKQCKLEIGVPLLCMEDPGYAEAWFAIEGKLTYEQQLDIMRFYPVTSLFNKQQGSIFIDEIIRLYSLQGLSLINPKENPPE